MRTTLHQDIDDVADIFLPGQDRSDGNAASEVDDAFEFVVDSADCFQWGRWASGSQQVGPDFPVAADRGVSAQHYLWSLGDSNS